MFEEQLRHAIAFHKTGLHAEAGFTTFYPECEFIEKSPNDYNNLLWYSILHVDAPETNTVDTVEGFSISTMLTYSRLCHYVHCSMMYCRQKVWSVNPLPGRNSACSFLSL